MLHNIAVHTHASPSSVAESWTLEDMLLYHDAMSRQRAQSLADMAMATSAGFNGGDAAKNVNKIISELTG